MLRLDKVIKRAGQPKLRSLELKPEANVPGPPRKAQRTMTKIPQQETGLEMNVNKQQSLNLRE